MVFMVVTVKIDFIFVYQEVSKENYSYFNRVTFFVYKIFIEDIRVVYRWKIILKRKKNKNFKEMFA